MKDKKSGTFRIILSYLKPYAPLIVLIVLFAILHVALSLLIPLLCGAGIDCILGPQNVDFQKLNRILVAIACCSVLAALLQWGLNLLSQRAVYFVLSRVRTDAFEKIQVLPLKYLDSAPSGSLLSAIISDAEQFSDGLLIAFTQLFTGAATILGLVVMFFLIRWEIALVVLLITPLSLLSAKFISSKSYKMFKSQSSSRAEETAFIDESIGNLKTVKTFLQEENCGEKFDDLNENLRKISLKALFFSSVTNPVTRFINALVYALCALVGGYLVISSGGAFTVGKFGSALSFCTQYTKPFNEITEVVAEFQNALACAGRIFSISFLEGEKDAPDAKVLEGARGDVIVQSVDFSYEKNHPLIRDLSIDVKSGERVAIVGPTGCGKTTLINLLMRFYEIDGGAIFIDGEDIRKLSRKSLRENIGMVLQDTFLKNATVRENICMGKRDVSEEEMIEAAKMAHAHGFIMQMRDGYDTVLSEQGSLSQGQKQLLCIARVMLLKPPMLILDEATSNIDTRTEKKVQDAFEKLMQGRTSFIVAHRLSTIQNADLILVMDAGRIVERGTHEELLEKRGKYFELYQSRF